MAAILIAWRAPNSFPLKQYLCAQLIVTLVDDSFVQVFGWQSAYYTVVYAIGSLVILGFMVMICFYFGGHYSSAVFISAALACVVASDLHRQVSSADWVLFIEGTALCAVGASIGFPDQASAERPYKLGVLAFLWLLNGLMDFGIVLHPDSETWALIRDVGNYVLLGAGFMIIAIMSYWEHYHQRHASIAGD